VNGKLENKVAVVTGVSAGIGFGAAKRFADEGARVFITGRRQSELDNTVAAIEGNVTAIQGDVYNLADIDGICETVKIEADRMDVLFVNAGFYEFGKFGEIAEEHSDKTFNTNVRGLLFAVQKALPLLSQGSLSSLAQSHRSRDSRPSRSTMRARRRSGLSPAVGSMISREAAFLPMCQGECQILRPKSIFKTGLEIHQTIKSVANCGATSFLLCSAGT
jgi:NAD(P)-dependent dehydrogenase (short-subunit alcohol dehydrogenase family)